MLVKKVGCDNCVLPEGYAGYDFQRTAEGSVCVFCVKFRKKDFKGDDSLRRRLEKQAEEQIGVTVSGGKDSTYVWLWLVQEFGPERVVAFNHRKIGLAHPIAEDNLERAKRILRSELVKVDDYQMLERFKRNSFALFSRPDPAMVRVALCAGCRFGITGRLFLEAQKRGITTIVNGASYLELAPFKEALMIEKGSDERQGLINGILENTLYDFPSNIEILLLEDQHCHAKDLVGKSNLYPAIDYIDFYEYMPNDPMEIAQEVRKELDWKAPKERDWHFDCLVGQFKDLCYYGILGYTEADYRISEMIRYRLITREEGLKNLQRARQRVYQDMDSIFNELNALGIDELEPLIRSFIKSSPYLS